MKYALNTSKMLCWWGRLNIGLCEVYWKKED
jgi:hypothetical protein